jgi:tRNA threonylcarbamoyladenosine biosynthesis protein TsaE
VTALSTRWVCPDPAATRNAAAEVAESLKPGDVILLEGDLGAGKTTFVQGLAAALGVDAPVTSPTFTLMNVYRTSRGFDLVHVDAYRLEQLSEVVDLALPEILDDGAVAVIEWGERAAPILPGARRIVFNQSGDDGERLLRMEYS